MTPGVPWAAAVARPPARGGGLAGHERTSGPAAGNPHGPAVPALVR